MRREHHRARRGGALGLLRGYLADNIPPGLAKTSTRAYKERVFIVFFALKQQIKYILLEGAARGFANAASHIKRRATGSMPVLGSSRNTCRPPQR